MQIINFREGKPWNITLELFWPKGRWVFLYFAFWRIAWCLKIEHLGQKYRTYDPRIVSSLDKEKWYKVPETEIL